MANLIARNLKKVIGDKLIVSDVSLEVNSGEVVGLLGPNGAGKTTTFYMIAGLLSQTKGHVLLNGNDISQYPIHLRARFGIGYLPQESSIFKDMSVEENLLLAAEAGKLDKEKREKRVLFI